MQIPAAVAWQAPISPQIREVAQVPAHAAEAHLSLVVQALPSSHARVLVVNAQPVAAWHESLVQKLLSLQSLAAVHASPSLH